MTVQLMTLDYVTMLATTGRAGDIDVLMQRLDNGDSFVERKLVDHALGLVESREGAQRIRHYLFAGTLIQRNYAALYFKRRNAVELLADAVASGAIDTVQAFAR